MTVREREGKGNEIVGVAVPLSFLRMRVTRQTDTPQHSIEREREREHAALPSALSHQQPVDAKNNKAIGATFLGRRPKRRKNFLAWPSSTRASARVDCPLGTLRASTRMIPKRGGACRWNGRYGVRCPRGLEPAAASSQPASQQQLCRSNDDKTDWLLTLPGQRRSAPPPLYNPWHAGRRSSTRQASSQLWTMAVSTQQAAASVRLQPQPRDRDQPRREACPCEHMCALQGGTQTPLFQRQRACFNDTFECTI